MNDGQYFAFCAGTDLRIWKSLIGKRVLHCTMGVGVVTDIIPNGSNQRPCILIQFNGDSGFQDEYLFPATAFSTAGCFPKVSLPPGLPSIAKLEQDRSDAWLSYTLSIYRSSTKQPAETIKLCEQLARRLTTEEKKQREEDRKKREDAAKQQAAQLAAERWQREELARQKAAQARLQQEEAYKRVEAERKQREAERKRQEEKLKLQEEELRLAAEKRLQQKNVLVARLTSTFQNDFLSADSLFASDPDSQLIGDEEYRRMKISFVGNWVNNRQEQLLGKNLSLDEDQVSAIAATTGDIQVVARAGSGKTRTLVTRTIFLQQHCGVSPQELLVLTFNKKASEEVKERLKKVLGDYLPHVMTFHALAHALIHPEEELLYDQGSEGQQSLSREIQEVIDEHIRSPNYKDLIRSLMLAHFREDWERIADGRFHLTMDEFLEHRRSLARESLRGEYVKSFGERLIANTLFEHAVEYKYERAFHWDGVNYRPDFTIPFDPSDLRRGGVIIEYFGLAGDADYDERSAQKRQFWSSRAEWLFLEFTPQELARLGVATFAQLLIEKLVAAGVLTRRRTEEEIWELIRARAIDHFTKAMRSFVGRCRISNLSIAELATMIDGHPVCSPAEDMFIRVGASIYTSYLQLLATKNKEDFNGLMWRAAAAVRNGQTRFVRDRGREQGDLARLRFVMIDEFQDFSKVFWELVDAFRVSNSRVQFFCVGDDWQAINGFAGSDTRFFDDFATYFQNTSRLYIRTNYRSPKNVVDVGNALMHGRGAQARAASLNSGWIRVAAVDTFDASATEKARHSWDDITPAVLRLIKHFLEQDHNIVMLSRRHSPGWYVNYQEKSNEGQEELERFLAHVQSFIPQEDRNRVSISTAHAYKGREKLAVIVLDATAWSYPLIHPDWIFMRIFGNNLQTILDEERRLFYVALTRSQHSLVFLTDSLKRSPFLGDISTHIKLEPLSWNTLTPMPGLNGPYLEIRVSNAYEIRDQLKNEHFNYVAVGKYWRRNVTHEGFSFDAWLSKPWASGRVHIEVYTEDRKLLCSNRTQV